MDIYCPICSEPWDMECIHEEIAERIDMGVFAPLPDHDGYRQWTDQYKRYRAVYDEYYHTVRIEFRRRGCGAFWAFSGHAEGDKPSWCAPKESKSGKLTAAAASSVLMDLMGDDLDGVASMMDDAYSMGMID